MRLRNALRELADGRPAQPLNFRDDDFWRELAVDFNQAAARVVRATAELDSCTEAMPEDARKKYPHLGLVTVYRTLDLLTEFGYVQRVHFNDGCHSYIAAGQGHAHQLVCSNCGKAQEFEDCDLGPLIASLQRKTGYEINLHVLELMGHSAALNEP